MSADTIAFWIIVVVNTVMTIVYYFFSISKKNHQPGLKARCVVMLVCPIIGPVYFALGWLLRKIFFHKPVELTDVIFSKERMKTLLKADEEDESHIVSVEDTITIVDRQNARTAMLSVLRRDIRGSLGSIFNALDSDDSEISHYAAAMLQSELSKFRKDTQKTVEQIDRTERELQEIEEFDGQLKTATGEAMYQASLEAGEALDTEDGDLEEGTRKARSRHTFADIGEKLDLSEDYVRHERSAYEQGLRAFYGTSETELTTEQKLHIQIDAAHKLLRNVHEVLHQKVLSDVESAHYTILLERMANLLVKRDVLTASEMSWVAEDCLARGDLERCQEWSDLLIRTYPDTLEAYSTRLHLLYSEGEWGGFSETMEKLKASGIPLDHEMMELVRVYI